MLKIVIALIFISFYSYAKPNCHVPKNSLLVAKVVKVSDGDTIKVILTDPSLEGTECMGFRQNVRFLYIDTPETQYQVNGYKFSQGKWGDLASDEMKSRVKVGDEVLLEFGSRPQDGYGRFLAEVHHNQTNLNILMVEKGLAFPIFFSPQLEKSWDYIEANLRARATGAGIFSEPGEVLTPREFRISVAGGSEGMLIGNILTGEVVSGEQYKEVLPMMRLHGRRYEEMIRVLAKNKKKITDNCVELLSQLY